MTTIVARWENPRLRVAQAPELSAACKREHSLERDYWRCTKAACPCSCHFQKVKAKRAATSISTR
jgi:hypothetical protein